VGAAPWPPALEEEVGGPAVVAVRHAKGEVARDGQVRTLGGRWLVAGAKR
jgi:hypothetical protein